LYLREWDHGRKGGPLSSEKALNSKPTRATEPEVSKNAKQCFFMPTPSKKAKKMPNYDVHAKHHFFMPNHFKKGQILGTWP